jgi:hypothetical protein
MATKYIKTANSNDIYALDASGNPQYVSDPKTVDWKNVSTVDTIPGSPAGGSTTTSGAGGFESYLSDAQKQLDPGFQDVLNAVQQQGANTQSMYQDLSKSTLAREPVVRQQYANLAKELEQSQTTETAQAKQVGEQSVGSAEASMAAAGVEGSAQGAFRAPLTAAQNQQTNAIQSVADKYGVKFETLNDTLNADINTLYDTANKYLIQGNQEASAAVTQLAQLKYQHNTELMQLAKSEQAADTAAQKEAWKEYIDQRRADQTDERIAQSASTFAAALGKSTAAQDRQNTLDQQKITTAYYDDVAKYVDPNKSGTSLTPVQVVRLLVAKYPQADPSTIADDIKNEWSGDSAALAPLDSFVNTLKSGNK